ncbi:MAG: Uma2 family endonuclease, partial [Vicinamibacterales bacterium]
LVPGSDRMRPASPGVKLTYDDFVHFPDDGKRHELIDGEHYVTPTPNLNHQSIVGNLYWLIRSHLESRPLGTLFGSPVDVVLSEIDVVEPDLAYVSNERREILTKQNVRGAPDLVVEVGSPSTRKRDETIKLRLYERWGVSEYWVVDPELETVRVYRRAGERFESPVELSRERGERLITPLFPELELPLARVFST